MLFIALAVLAVTASVSGSNHIWVKIPPTCDNENAIKKAFDVRGVTPDNQFIAIVNVNFYHKCKEMITALGAAELDVPAVVLPVIDNIREKFSPVYSSNEWMLIQSNNMNEIINMIPSKVEPDILATTAIKPKSKILSLAASKANPAVIEELVSNVTQSVIIDFLEDLTALHTRLSTASSAALLAAEFVRDSFSERLVDSDFWDYSFPVNYPPNVIGRIQGRTNRLVILGAHFDDRAQNINDANARAPGANDDGSGTAALLEAARIFSASGYQFENTIEFCAFSGEEQGLYGSTAYANYMLSQGADIVAMIQSDMIAHKFPGNPNKMELSTRYADEDLNAEVEAIALQYVPELEVGRTTACCSDQQPFYNNGYYATALVEAGGYTVDPQYHTTTDVMYRDDYSFDQLELITKCLLPLLLLS
eukprot:c3658_g1_i1.p1 GENE.c3658_g1_i1~~c3658_g1_i1.p1  ORF type:complete len:421 (+),score=33.86 c3658_g1_i1:3-1265(+)